MRSPGSVGNAELDAEIGRPTDSTRSGSDPLGPALPVAGLIRRVDGTESMEWATAADAEGAAWAALARPVCGDAGRGERSWDTL